MPYTTVVSGTTITAAYGNANIRDQVVTPFASASARDSAISAPIQGMLEHLNDTNTLVKYNGSAWVAQGAQLISSATVTGSAVATISFSSIPGFYNSLLMTGLAIGTAVANNVDFGVRFNGDTGANYSQCTWDASQAALNPAGSFQSGVTAINWFGSMPGTSFASTKVCGWSAIIPGYSTTTLNKATLSDMWLTDGGTSFNTHKRWGYWKSTSAITSMTLLAGSGNFDIGTTFNLWGLP